MTLTIDLEPEVEQSLAARAGARGISVAEYAKEVLSAGIGVQRNPEMTGEERAEAFLRWTRSLPPRTPVLSDEAMTRASFYQDHD